MNRRNILNKLQESLSDTPVTFLRGARQTGKTTLVKSLCQAESDTKRHYISLDSATALVAALDDPTGFLQGLPKPLVIDEAQRAPNLMLAIKEDVDSKRTPGQYLLTGSANILALPGIADSLAGRMELLTMYPLSQGEFADAHDDFIAVLFADKIRQIGSPAPFTKNMLLVAMSRGGYPETLSRPSPQRMGAWFDSYISTLVERDIRDIANIQDRSGLLRLLQLLGARSGTIYNQSEISRSSGIPNSTLARYIALLEALFLVWFMPAWSGNLGKRLVKSPKVHLCDSGLISHLCGADNSRLQSDSMLAGRIMESFVACEILKQGTWSSHPATLYHYRTQSGEEVDMVLEDRSGRVAAIEVKLSSSIGRTDYKGLAALRDTLGEHFANGVVVYTGSELVPLGDRIWAVPIGMVFAGV